MKPKTKTKNLAFVGILGAAITVFSCTKKEDNSNINPKLEITSPQEGTVFNQGEIVTITADAQDSDGAISMLRFDIDGVTKSETSSAPYVYNWPTADENIGQHQITVTATDNQGASVTDQLSVIIQEAIPAPVAAFTASIVSGIAPVTVYFTDQSTNGPTSWQWDFGDGNSSDLQNPSHTYQNPGSFTVELTVSNSSGSATETKANYIVLEEFFWNDVSNPLTGETWMDRNLGASRVAISSDDVEAYGDLYQWGRLADGHEKRSSAVMSMNSFSDTDVPGHGSFIIVNSLPFDWRNPQNDNLWQPESGINNPCPAGYRIPTQSEWEAERTTWSSSNTAGAFNSVLKLPLAGNRGRFDGSLASEGNAGYYWSSTIDNNYSYYFFFFSTDAGTTGWTRAEGYSVRCIKE